MQTLDCWRSNSTGELTVICTGMATAPIAIDLETGASVTLHPAWARTELARFGIASVIMPRMALPVTHGGETCRWARTAPKRASPW